MQRPDMILMPDSDKLQLFSAASRVSFLAYEIFSPPSVAFIIVVLSRTFSNILQTSFSLQEMAGWYKLHFRKYLLQEHIPFFCFPAPSTTVPGTSPAYMLPYVNAMS